MKKNDNNHEKRSKKQRNKRSNKLPQTTKSIHVTFEWETNHCGELT